jgi:TonB-linked SusC/RagA family outer membrane protein
MQLKVFGPLHKTLLAMKLLILLMTVVCLQVSASGYGQSLSLSLNNASLEKAFKEIKRQTGYSFVYTRDQLKNAPVVTVNLKNTTLKEGLDACFSNQSLSYVIEDRYIIILTKPVLANDSRKLAEITGRILSENGETIAGATIAIKGTTIATASNNDGVFTLEYPEIYNTIVITSIGYATREVSIINRVSIDIVLHRVINSLDEAVVIAYGKTTRRFNTGNVSKVNGEDISKQPVSNPLAALQGRVPGLVITQTSGLNGASFKVQIRGQSSLFQGSDPLYIIDGVPYAAGNAALNQISNSTSTAGLSPLNLINPSDIESVEVMKDADATAIYGSRGANGVIFITTKKGSSGKTKFNFNFYTGASTVTRTMDFLNTEQYLEMRREAFKNDGIIPNTSNAPDLTLWDTTTYVDLKKLLIGGTANTFDAQTSFSGGNSYTQFLISGGYHRQTTVFPNSLADQRASMHLNLNHFSEDKKFSLNLSTTFSSDKNELNRQDLTPYALTSPPIIKLYDSAGNLNFIEKGVEYRTTLGSNPLALSNNTYTGNFQNLISSLQLNYRLMPGLYCRTNLGYNLIYGDEVSTSPSTSIDPYTGQLPYSYFANKKQKSWSVEPQLDYSASLGKAHINILAGMTWQEIETQGTYTYARNYTSDIFINSISAAGLVTPSNSFSEYRYNAFFGRINFNWATKYVLNLTGRRDGSSRFGPANQFSNFGAAGIGWILSNEKFFKKFDSKNNTFLKIRGSYGITGNDQIGDYKFIDTWTSSATTYQGTTSLNPTSLFNEDYSWEINRKLEAAVEIGILKDKILFSAAYFRNQCGNQIVNYTLPIQTGFSSIGKNLDALIENKGLELQLTTNIPIGKNLKWSTVFNLTFAKNKLLDFPDLETSSYATTFIIGSSVSARRKYHSLGVNPQTGIAEVQDADQSGTINTNDRIIIVNTDPRFYGGLQNTFTYKNFQLDIFLDFRKQKGANYLFSLSNTVPGYRFSNQPSIVLNRWQKPGDISDIQRFTSSASSQAYNNAIRYVVNSDVVYSDASFIRCKNLTLSYQLPKQWIKSLKAENFRLYITAQNLFVITNYVGADPENQSLFILPPLKTITGGIQFNF